MHKLLESNTSVSGTSIVQLIMNKLNLPEGSALLVAPIAASVLGLGVNAFCMHHKEDKSSL